MGVGRAPEARRGGGGGSGGRGDGRDRGEIGAGAGAGRSEGGEALLNRFARPPVSTVVLVGTWGGGLGEYGRCRAALLPPGAARALHTSHTPPEKAPKLK